MGTMPWLHHYRLGRHRQTAVTRFVSQLCVTAAAWFAVAAENSGKISCLWNFGWGARIRTWDDGTKTRCLTAWLRPNASVARTVGLQTLGPFGGRHHSQRAARPQLLHNPG